MFQAARFDSSIKYPYFDNYFGQYPHQFYGPYGQLANLEGPVNAAGKRLSVSPRRTLMRGRISQVTGGKSGSESP